MKIVTEIPDAIAQRLQEHWSNLTHKVLELLFQAAQQAEIISEIEAETVLQSHKSKLDAAQVNTAESKEDVLTYMEQQSSLYQEHQERLLQTHKGQYIVFENGHVLDAGVDFENLILRTFSQDGPKDVFVQQN